MSIDIDTQVVLGISVDSEEITTTVTKYNEDTGKPYQKKKTTKIFRVGDRQFNELYEIEEMCQEPLSFVYDMYDDGGWLGISLLDLGPNEIDALSVHNLTGLKSVVELGIWDRFGVKCDTDLWVISRVS